MNQHFFSPARDVRVQLGGTTRSGSAFTRLELLAVTAGASLLLAAGGSMAAMSRARADRVSCVNNLRQIAAAMRLWGNEHQDRFPMQVPTSEGGTRQHPLAVNPWLHYAWLSNELTYAHVLVCPADQGQRVARDFSADPTGGYLHPNFRNSATSYFLSHTPIYPMKDSYILAGDRNLRSDGLTGCSTFNSASSVDIRPSSPAWSTNLHRSVGNVSHADGRVEELSSQGFYKDFAQTADDNGGFHFITPR